MAATNPGEMDDLDLGPGADLNLDDDSLFAELDGEVMAGGDAGTDDLDFDLGDGASTGAGDDIDLDLGGDVSAAGGDLELDLELSDDAGAATAGDDLDLGGGDTADDLDLDLGGGGGADDLDLDMGAGDAGTAGDLDLDLGGDDDLGAGGATDDLDLDLGGDDAGAGDMDLDLGGDDLVLGGDDDLSAGGTADDLDLDLGGDDAGAADMDLDLGGDGGDLDLELDDGIGEAEASAGDSMDLDLGADDGGIDLGALGTDELTMEEAPVGDDMEALDLDVGEADMDDLDLGAVDAGLEDIEPEPEPVEDLDMPADDDLGADELAMGSMKVPDEPVFDMGADSDATSASADPVGGSDFHAADDIQLDEEPLQLELDEVDLESVEESVADDFDAGAFDPGMGAIDLTEEAPGMAAASAMEFEPTPEPEEADMEFSAVQDTHVDDDTLLELNLDDVEQMSEEDDAFMAQPQMQAASAMDDTIPLTEQLEIPSPGSRQARRAGGVAGAAHSAAPAGNMLNNEILMAVSHQISVQLGALALNGKELLDIGYGSVLPLDRMIGEPVDLVLDNKTIAQAEVVLINGKNLGVRIVALNR